MPEDLYGQSMYDRAIELVEDGILVAIVAVRSSDNEHIGLYALTQDLKADKVVHRAALSPRIGHRAACALGLTMRTRRAATERGMKLRHVPNDY